MEWDYNFLKLSSKRKEGKSIAETISLFQSCECLSRLRRGASGEVTKGSWKRKESVIWDLDKAGSGHHS